MMSSPSVSTSPLMRRRPSLTTPRSQPVEWTSASASSRPRSATRLSDRNVQGRDAEVSDRNPSSSPIISRGETTLSPVVHSVGLGSPANSRLAYGIPEELQPPTKKKSSISLVALPEVPRRNSSVSHKGPLQDRSVDSSIAPPFGSPLRSPLPITSRMPLPQPPMPVPRPPSESSDYGSDADPTENLDTGSDAENVAAEDQASRYGEQSSSRGLQLGLEPPTVQRPQRHEVSSVQSGAVASAPAPDAQLSTSGHSESIVVRSDLAAESPDHVIPQHRASAPTLEDDAQGASVLHGHPLPAPIKFVEGTALSSETELSDAGDHGFSVTPAIGDTVTDNEAALEAALLKAAEAEDPNRPRALKEARELAKARARARQMSEAGEMRQRPTDSRGANTASTSHVPEQNQASLTSTSVTSDGVQTSSGIDKTAPRADPSSSAGFSTLASPTPDALAHQIRTMDDLQAAVGDVLQSMTFGSDPSGAARLLISGRQRESVSPDQQPLHASSRSGSASREAVSSGLANEASAFYADGEPASRSSIESSISSPQGFVTPHQQILELPTFDSIGTIQAAADHDSQAIDSDERRERSEALQTPSTPSGKRHPSQEDTAFSSGFPTPVVPSSHAAINDVRQKPSSYFPPASPASASNNASYPLAPLVQKRSSSQQINAATKLGVPGRTIPMPAAFNAASIYSDRRKLPPWERARGYAQCVNELSHTPSGLTLWMEAAQRRPVAGGSSVARNTGQIINQSGQLGSSVRYPSDLGASGPHPRDASGASARSDMTFPMRGDGGKARDVTDTTLDRTPADAMPGAVPSNIPYPALARNQHHMQEAMPQDSSSVSSAKAVSSQQTFAAPPPALPGRADLRQQTPMPASDYGSQAVAPSGSSGRTGLFALGRRGSKRGPHPGPIAMLTSSGSTASVTGPRLPRTGGGGSTAASGRAMGYASGSAAEPPSSSVSSPTSASPHISNTPLPISPPSSAYSGASQVPLYPGSAQGRTTEPGPMGPRTQALRSAASTRSFSNASASSQAQQPQQAWQQATSASQHRLEHVEPAEFTRALRALRDVLPDADEDVLRGYLRRAGGRDEVKAIGDYLSDQRAGRLRA